MRLLRTKTIQLAEFSDNEIPQYAILSHTWQDEEVTFHDMQRSEINPQLQRRAGYAKIKHCCARAVAQEIDYVWIDTCCIDKTSSAELSEAINSMYRWYRRAKRCYAYLADVPAEDNIRKPLDSAFARSRWFKRGWTLQELIAPADVRFFASDWTYLGTKAELKHEIAEITGICTEILDGADPGIASIAQRMSWASNRQTTKVEDIAYCLLGLFAVNMPMLYGEGEKAFIRLQEEILKTEVYSIYQYDQYP